MVWQSPPQIVQWDITSRCNLKCKHCRAANLDDSTEDLTFEEIVSILRQINILSPEIALAVAGGEPLARKDLKDIFVFIKRHFNWMSIELLTNATLIDKGNVDWLIGLVDGFNVSLDGASPEIHERIRGKGAFQKTIDGIKLLVQRNARVAVRMTYFHQGREEPENLMRLLSGLGVDLFNFRYLVPVGRASQKKVDSEEYKELCYEIVDLGRKLDMQVGFSDPFPEILIDDKEKEKIIKDEWLMCGKAVSGCSAGFSLLYLNPKGMVQLCPYFPLDIADARNSDLKKIWYENEMLNLFRNHRASLKGKCGECEYKFACGGCRGAAWASGDFLGEEPRCWKK